MSLTPCKGWTGAWPQPPRVIRESRNLGFAAANNRAVARLPDCELVALLNPDAFPDPGWLAALLAAAAAHPEAASFASRLMLEGEPDVLDGAGDVCHVSGLVWRHGHRQPLSAVPDALHARPAFSACAAAALYRRADWERVGGFDERFFCYAEDVDLGFRLQLIDRPCWYVPDAVAFHMASATSGVGSPFAIYHGHRNLEWMFAKNLPTRLLWRYLPLHAAMLTGGLAYFAGRGRLGAYLEAKWDALAGLGAAWRERRIVQKTRRVSAADLDARLAHGAVWRRTSGPVARASSATR